MNDSRELKILYLFGIIPCIWLGLLISPYINGGLIEIVKGLHREKAINVLKNRRENEK